MFTLRQKKVVFHSAQRRPLHSSDLLRKTLEVVYRVKIFVCAVSVTTSEVMQTRSRHIRAPVMAQSTVQVVLKKTNTLSLFESPTGSEGVTVYVILCHIINIYLIYCDVVNFMLRKR